MAALPLACSAPEPVPRVDRISVRTRTCEYCPLGDLDWGHEPGLPERPWTENSLRDWMQAHPKEPLSLEVKTLVERCHKIPALKLRALPKTMVAGAERLDERFFRSEDGARLAVTLLADESLCARVAPPENQREFTMAALGGILAWTQLYEPAGDIVRDAELLPVLYSIDLLYSKMEPAQQSLTKRWLKRLVDAGDRAMGASRLSKLGASGLRGLQAWHLLVRSTAQEIRRIDDPDNDPRPAELAEREALWRDQIENDLSPEGAESDARLHDALGYQVHALEAYARALFFLPHSGIGAAEKEKVRAALLYLKPYFSGERAHLEHGHPLLRKEKIGLEDGDAHFKPRPWNPDQARGLYKLAGVVFEEMRREPLSKRADKIRFDQWLTVACALHLNAPHPQ